MILSRKRSKGKIGDQAILYLYLCLPCREKETPAIDDDKGELEVAATIEVEEEKEDPTPSQHVEKRKKKRRDKRKTNTAGEGSPSNPFKTDMTEGEDQHLKPRVVVPSPTGNFPLTSELSVLRM